MVTWFFKNLWSYSNSTSGIMKKTYVTFFPTWNITPQSWKNTQKQKSSETSKSYKSAIMDFQSTKFWEFVLLNNHYQISKNEGNQNFKLSGPAWFLQKLALNTIWIQYGFVMNMDLLLHLVQSRSHMDYFSESRFSTHRAQWGKFGPLILHFEYWVLKIGHLCHRKELIQQQKL